MQPPLGTFVFRNLANVVSILGVLPLCLLFQEDGFRYLIPLIVYNNIMDDLDGVLAGKLDIRSQFGAQLDNVCDSISHTVFVLVVGMYYFQAADCLVLGGACLAGSLLVAVAMIVRTVARLDPSAVSSRGSPTNEAIRHVFFVLLLTEPTLGFSPTRALLMEPTLGFNPTPVLLIAVFVLHSVSMLVPFRLPYLIRSLTKSATTIGLVNVALVVAWLVPYTAPVVAAAFVGAYLWSFAAGGIRWRRETDTLDPP